MSKNTKCHNCKKECNFRTENVICDTRDNEIKHYCSTCLPPKVSVPILGDYGSHTLCQLANNTALRFGAPVFLVGSALTSKEPLDIDIVMQVFDNQYDRIIAPESETNWAYHSGKIDNGWKRWLRFQMKQKEYFESGLRPWNIEIDFKIQRFNLFYAHTAKFKKARLDFFTDFF